MSDYHRPHQSEPIVIAPPKRVYSVKVAGSKRRVKVEADYFRVDCGILTFRNQNSAGYPFMVRTFAAGEWKDIA